MEGDHIKINYWLLPLSWLYGLVVSIRNLMFDVGMLKSKTFPLPVICVGNVTVGGTGKTPHTEYLIRLLSKDHQVAVLSRGYKRKSEGYVLATKDTPMAEIGDEPYQMKATKDTPMAEIGDEPYQMKQKYPQIHMAVDKDRCHGINQLMQNTVKPQTDVVILDDAYQHRYVKAGLNILLMDYHRLIHLDKLLPAGRLREPMSGSQRADIVIITKCPRDINELMSFPDHHNFTEQDINAIRTRAAGRTILTTEKDATRLHGLDNMKVIPIEVEFIEGKEKFDKMIKNYVNKKD